MKYLLIILAVCSSLTTFSQKWVDTIYSVSQTNNIEYGSALDFAGNIRKLKMNVCVPTNDTPPTCGRPLLIAIHGGAFMAGNKDADSPPYWLTQFAKRGYTTASINYRLGMFQTDAFVNCNVSAFGILWNCLNIQDTSEWYRAPYRAMQDAKSAIRFLVNNANTYNIDPRNIYLVGESAGGFIAMASAYLDDPSEKPIQCGGLSNASAPNTLYEVQCIQNGGFDTSIASMQLTRPDLGSIDGHLNPTSIPYTIKGVGNFFGGMITNLFTKNSYAVPPVLYMFHQPNDLLVPYDYDNICQGAAYCYTLWPASCGWIINRPKVYGSKGIKTLIDNLPSSTAKPTYYFDTTANYVDCIGQIANPSTVGHAIDNLYLRTRNMAQFFAPTIDTSSICIPTSINNVQATDVDIKIYPNPSTQSIIFIESNEEILHTELSDLNGRFIPSDFKNGKLHAQNLAHGMYLLRIRTAKSATIHKVIFGR